MINIEEDIVVVGLGNIGLKYENTRHNSGFDVLDNLSGLNKFSFQEERKFYGDLAKLKGKCGNNIYLLKPSTFMNESGVSLEALINFYKLDKNNIIIIQDDMDLQIGQVRCKYSNKDGGHRGIRSINQHLNLEESLRLKVGIGHPPKNITVVDWVLSRFSGEEKEIYEQGIDDATILLQLILSEGYDKGMNKFQVILKKRKVELEK